MRLLYLVHSLPPAESSGSPLQAHGYALAMAAAGHQVTVVTTDERIGPPSQPRLRTHETGGYEVASFAGTEQRWVQWAQTDFPTAPRPVDRSHHFRALLERTRPDVVHVLDMVHLPSEWPRVAAAAGIPVVRTFCNAEDLCGLIEPVHGPGGVCEIPIDPVVCAGHCVRMRPITLAPGTTTFGELEQRIASWIDQAGSELARALTAKRAALEHDLAHTYAAVIFATAGWRDQFAGSVELPADRTHVVALGIDPVDVTPPPAPVGRPITFGFLAPPLHNKGSDVLLSALQDQRIAARDDLRFLVWGDWPTSGPIASAWHDLRHVQVRGRYEPDWLGDVLAELDVGLCLSRFETFHRVTRELLGAGRAVIGTTAAGIADVLRHEHNGLRIPPGEADALVHAILRLADDRELLARCQQGAALTPVSTPRQELEQLLAVYEAVLTSPSGTVFDGRRHAGKAAAGPA